MRTVSISAAVAALAVSAPALAANSGAYVGTGVTHDNFASSADLEGIGSNGLGVTIYAGYDLPVSENAFVGVEANFDLGSAKVGEDVDGSFKLDNAFGASARAGYNLNSSTALYGRVGFQRSRTTERADTEKLSTSRNGLRLGAGLETALSEQLSLRAEYNRTSYGLTKLKKLDLGANQKGGFNNNQFSIGLSFGF